MTMRIEDWPILGVYVIVLPGGNYARTTENEVFETNSLEGAEEALAYLTQDVPPGGKRVGAHWLKSTFGVF